MSATTGSELPTHLCGRSLRGVMHACVFVDSREQQYRMLLPYLQEGKACNAHLVTMVSAGHVREHLERLRRAGLDPALLSAGGRLTVSTPEETFPRDGSATPTSVLIQLESRIEQAQRAGFSGVRGFWEMSGALAALRRTDELLEYEARANFVALKTTTPIVCVYDLAQTGGALVVDLLRTHPKLVLDGVLHENPYFVPPVEYLRLLVERRRRQLRVRERRAFTLRI